MVFGPLAGFIVALLLWREGYSFELSAMAALGIWMAVWWINEAVSIYLTALIPAFAMPFLGIMEMKEVASAYLPQIIFLFVGGFLLAFAVEKWGLHKRIALNIILKLGSHPARLLLGFMLSSYLLSMWILNTATVMLLLPAVLAVIGSMKNAAEKKLYTPFLLGLAFASSIGGFATLVGTAPNMFLMEFYNELNNYEAQINFLNWFILALPLSIMLFMICYGLIYFIFLRKVDSRLIDLNYCRTALRSMGKASYEEKIIAVVFGLLILAWFTARDIPFANFEFKGWLNLLPHGSYVKESTIAMFAAFLLFLIPSKKEKINILEWKDSAKIPIGVLFLFGGGFALAKGIVQSGLAGLLTEQLSILNELPAFAIVLLLTLFMTFLTELSSNTASTVLVLPVLAAILANLGMSPSQVLFPVTIAASCAFMLPVATPPNTIIFSSKQLKVRDMARVGIWLNLISALLISIYFYYFADLIFGI